MKLAAAISAMFLAFAQNPALAQEEDEGHVVDPFGVKSGDEETPAVATPEDTAEAKSRAAAVLNEGNTFFEQRKYSTALAKYESAYRIFASPKILFNIAEAHRELGHVDEALQHYERFLKEANIEPGSVLHEKVMARLQELRSQSGYLAFESGVSGAEVKIDGRSVGKTPFEKPVLLGGGVHEVTAEMPGYQAYRENVEVGVGKTATVKLDLVPGTAVASAGGEKQAQPPITAQTAGGEEEPLTSQWWFWTAIGVVVVVGGVAVIAATSSHGNDFIPMGALGSSSTSTWQKF